MDVCIEEGWMCIKGGWMYSGVGWMCSEKEGGLCADVGKQMSQPSECGVVAVLHVCNTLCTKQTCARPSQLS